jgi:hypothetical protein
MADPLSITASIIAVLQLTSVVAQYLKDIKGGFGDRLTSGRDPEHHGIT